MRQYYRILITDKLQVIFLINISFPHSIAKRSTIAVTTPIASLSTDKKLLTTHLLYIENRTETKR